MVDIDIEIEDIRIIRKQYLNEDFSYENIQIFSVTHQKSSHTPYKTENIDITDIFVILFLVLIEMGNIHLNAHTFHYFQNIADNLYFIHFYIKMLFILFQKQGGFINGVSEQLFYQLSIVLIEPFLIDLLLEPSLDILFII